MMKGAAAQRLSLDALRTIQEGLPGVKRPDFRSGFVLAAIALSSFFHTSARADDWAFYAGTRQGEVHDSTLREWCALNRLNSVPENEATVLHYYDQDSVSSNSPLPGGIVKVWEKSVFKKETKSYEDAKADVEKEEAARLNRKIGVLDYGLLFPMAVNRATKEVTMFLQVNCSSKEFFIIEVNTYDKTGERMTREIIGDEYFWSPIRSNTIMEVLSRKICE
jgi:hypothetical protein